MAQAPCGMHDTHQQNESANEHHHPLHRVVEYAGAEPAKRGIQRDTHTENDQARLIGDTGCRLQQTCAADKLHRHCANKRHQQTQACQPYQQATLIASKQHIVQRYGIVATGQNGKLFTQYAQREPNGRQLDHGQQYPAQPVLISGARATDKRAGADVSSGQRHGQHDATH
ncbi:Uncharacterised protein [Enterobacter hormaechei]|nr:Uncharacterised protein [Enterobacter hormaechei]